MEVPPYASALVDSRFCGNDTPKRTAHHSRRSGNDGPHGVWRSPLPSIPAKASSPAVYPHLALDRRGHCILSGVKSLPLSGVRSLPAFSPLPPGKGAGVRGRGRALSPPVHRSSSFPHPNKPLSQGERGFLRHQRERLLPDEGRRRRWRWTSMTGDAGPFAVCSAQDVGTGQLLALAKAGAESMGVDRLPMQRDSVRGAGIAIALVPDGRHHRAGRAIPRPESCAGSLAAMYHRSAPSAPAEAAGKIHESRSGRRNPRGPKRQGESTRAEATGELPHHRGERAEAPATPRSNAVRA